MAELLDNRYGKRRIRLMKVLRNREPHQVIDWTLNILFRGDYDASFTIGENANVLPTDTMKNTVYSLARSSSSTHIEDFAIELGNYFLQGNSEVSEVLIEITEKGWSPVTLNGRSEPSTFLQSGQEAHTVEVTLTRDGTPRLICGLQGMLLLKTAHSEFAGFKRDSLTTLRETTDRLLGTEVTCKWNYQSQGLSFHELRLKLRETLLTEFSTHHSLSVQHTLHAMAQRVLNTLEEVEQITLVLPNRHCLLVDLSPFGQDNPNEIFVPIDEPHGYIEATLQRAKSTAG